MKPRIFVQIIVCCACLYACNNGVLFPSPSDNDFNYDSSFYPKRMGAQWLYRGSDNAQSGLSTDPWAPTWSYQSSRNWVWTLMKYEQISPDSATILISSVAKTQYFRSDSRYDVGGPNGGPRVITTTTGSPEAVITLDTGIIGISRRLMTLEFKHGLLQPMGIYWDGTSLNSSKYSSGPLVKRRGYYKPAGPFYSSRFASGSEFGQYEFIP
jgi:hypothetical protein